MIVLLVVLFLVLVFLKAAPRAGERKGTDVTRDLHLRRNRRSTTYAARQGRDAAHGRHP